MPVFEDAIVDEVPQDNSRPNILMLFSDQHTWNMTGYAGHPIVKTPNLDKIAARGVNFTNAYCNSPLCSPSRQSFMSGLHCYEIGMWNNVSSMPENTVTWARALSAAGYETMLCGKMHFNGYQKLYGFDSRPVPEGSSAGKQFYSWGLRTSHVWTDPLPYDKGKSSNWLLNEPGPDSDERCPIFQHDKRIAEGTIEVLKKKAAEKDGKPWALCCGMVLPHAPYKPRKDLWEMYEGKGDLPPNIHGEGLGDCDRYLRYYQGVAKNDYNEEHIRRLREAYYGLVTEYDEYVGRIMTTLEETGQADNTIIFYFSDHGDMLGENGLFHKVSLRDASAKIPMLVSWPGHYPEGVTVDTPVSLVDLYPTFLDIAGYKLPEILPLSGNSLMPLIQGKPDQFQGDSVFCEFEGEGWNHPRAFLRKGDWKYIFNHTARPELYNLADDPLEVKNLAGSPDAAEIEKKLHDKMMSFWDPEKIEVEVLRTQARQKLAYNRNVCEDLGW